MRREMSAFRSIKVNKNCVERLYCRCDAIGEDASPAGCQLTATGPREVAAAIAVIALLENKKFLKCRVQPEVA